MLELPHTIIGATIATKIGNPALAFPLAFLSNFLLDLLPHWNPHLNTELKKYGKISTKSYFIVFADVILGLIAGLYLSFRFWPDAGKVIFILSAIALAIIADTIEAPYFFFGWKNSFLKKLIAFQSRLQFNVPLVPGMISQAVFLGICFWLLFG